MKRIKFYKAGTKKERQLSGGRITKESGTVLLLTAFLCGSLLGAFAAVSGKTVGGTETAETPLSIFLKHLLLFVGMELVSFFLSTGPWGALFLPTVPLFLGLSSAHLLTVLLIQNGYAGAAVFAKSYLPTYLIAQTALLLYVWVGKGFSRSLAEMFKGRGSQQPETKSFLLFSGVILLVLIGASALTLFTVSND